MRRMISQKMIQTKVKALAKQIRTDYSDRVPIFIGILKGSFMFMADLIREYKDECELDFMAVASYGNYRTGAGVIRLIKDISVNIKKRDVLIVEDIIDTGLTSNYIRQYLQLRNPRSIEFVTLLDKRGMRRIDIKVKYIGFQIPSKFVVGYGLDYGERFRQLPYIAEHEDKERKK